MKDGSIVQVGHLVYDLDKALKHYCDKMGFPHWEIYEYNKNNMENFFYRGQHGDFSYVAAFAYAGDIQIEIIQPLEGMSIYNEHLEAKGEGFHHMKIFYEDCNKAVKQFKSLGIEVLQSGKIDQNEFFYLDTEPLFGAMYEIGNGGKKTRKPSRFYP